MSHDTLIHRIVRPPVRLLANTPVAPNAITACRIVTGFGAAVLVAAGGRWPDWGAGLFLVSALLDRADGELARQTGRFSRNGTRYDLIGDCLCNMMLFIALGVGAVLAGLPAAMSLCLLAIAAATGVAALFWHLNVVMPPAAMRRRPFDPDDAMLVAPVVVWLGGGVPMLVLAGIVTPVVALVLMLRDRRRARLPVGPAGRGPS